MRLQPSNYPLAAVPYMCVLIQSFYNPAPDHQPPPGAQGIADRKKKAKTGIFSLLRQWPVYQTVATSGWQPAMTVWALPARYRLQTGKCYVGALARSLSTLHKGTRKTIGTGRMAEIHISNKTMEQDETDLDLVGNIDNHINI